MHILSTIDSVQNFYTHSSEALSLFYKCFVIPLWWRRDTFTEDYSARDINHHLKNKAAICLERFLESTKAKFNEKSHESHSRRKDLLSRRLKPMHSGVITYPWYRYSRKWNQTHLLPTLRKTEVLPEAELDLHKTPAKDRDLTTWIWLWHRSSLKLPLTQIQPRSYCKITLEPTAGKHLV